MSLSGVAVSGRPNSFHTSARDQAATAVVVVAEKKEERMTVQRVLLRVASCFIGQRTVL